MPGADASEEALDRLLDALSAQAVSEPIQLEDEIIIPVHKVALGIATRMKRTGANYEEANEVENREEGTVRHASDGAAGGGVGITPVAVLIVSKGPSGPDGVKLIPLSSPGESLFDIAGDLMEKIWKRKKPGEKETADMAAVIIE
ncbi:MAG TPA: spore germination protein GerW family protein [Methanothrix sp.]|nr:spore germination protein GerW family protein [Methanothrix sp.]